MSASKKELRAALQALVNAGHTHTFVSQSPAFGHAIRVLRQSAPADAKLVLLPTMAEALRRSGPLLEQFAHESGNEFAAEAAAKVAAALATFEAL